ncbi:MAG: multicopper oxidase domain-containing protein [Actinomycetota bacterium]|nr:multicopper oxidase domain-containing protein [Actinomycetota bacterium]
MTRRPPAFALVSLLVVALAGGAGSAGMPALADEAAPASSRATTTGQGGQPYREPVVLAPVNGVLEVTLTAQQGEMTLDTAAGPVRNALLFGYRLARGQASNGEATGENLYPGPTLNVSPGETLIVHLENELTDLTIRDYQEPAFTPVGEAVPLYPKQLKDSPYNLHTHGLHVSPAGNGDNVLLNIPNGMTNTYTYAIPADHPAGLYWYHSHRHMLTTPQVYRGLLGMIVIGRADGGIPAVTQQGLPVRTMALQYNYVFNRAGGQTVMNNAFWPANVSTLKKATKASLANGTYEPRLTPINFADSPPGTPYVTAWWDGPLSVNNNRGVYQYLPSNLQTFVSDDGRTTLPAQPALPEWQRDVQYTVNGQFQPVISTPPGQTEIWVLGNFTDAGYMRVAITNTATGERTRLAIVGQDGNPYTEVQPALEEDGTVLLIPPASRYAIAVTMPQTGGLQLEMPTYKGSNMITTKNMGILYTSNGTSRPPAVTGNITVDPRYVSYADGFFVYPTQALLTATPSSGTGTTVPFAAGQPLDAYTSFVDLSDEAPDVTRTLRIGGGFMNENASDQDPNAFTYQFDDNQFPNIPLLQPRLNSTEQWNFVNENNDEHPIHIHVNDFQVVKYVDPVAGITLTDLPWGQDNQNTPAPLYAANGEDVKAPGRMSVRTEFQQFIGAYVLHCHRLNHEDNGLMAIINVIPEVTAYATALQGEGSRATLVRVTDQATGKRLASVTPFASWSGPVDVAMGDVNGDMVLDLIVGAGAGAEPRVRVFSGAPDSSDRAFRTVLLDRLVFAASFRGGVSVSSGNIDGTQVGDSVVVGSGPGMRATVRILKAGVAGGGGTAYHTWRPYGSFDGGVDVATGLVDSSGREVVVTAPGAGMRPLVKAWLFDLYMENEHAEGHLPHAHEPVLQDSFLAFDASYRGGVSVATGWVAGEQGGFSRIIAGMSDGGSEVAVFSSGSRQNGHPDLYVMPASEHSMAASFSEALRFDAFPGSTDGVDVTTSANTRSADLVVAGTSAGRPSVAVFDVRAKAKRPSTWIAKQLAVHVSPSTVTGIGGR